MRYRILSLLFLVMLSIFPVSAQIMFGTSVQSPLVDKQYASKIGKMKIESVSIYESYTKVEFSFVANRDVQQGVVSLSSKTLLTYKNDGGKNKETVSEWGIVDMFGYNRLKFDSRYQVRAGQTYRFYMVFPVFGNFLDGVEKISINEDKHKGFYWEGIHIKASSSKSKKSDSESDKKDKKKSDKKKEDNKKEERKQEYTPRRNNDSDTQGGVWI